MTFLRWFQRDRFSLFFFYLLLTYDLLATCDLLATFLRLTCDLLATYLLLATYSLLSCDLLATYLRLTCDLLATFLRITCYLLATYLRLTTYLRLSCPVTQLSHVSLGCLARLHCRETTWTLKIERKNRRSTRYFAVCFILPGAVRPRLK